MKEVKKLVLKKETITSLSGDEMNLLRGGGNSYTCGTGTSLGGATVCTCITCNNANTCFPTDYCPNPY